MRYIRRIQPIIALGILASWTLLFGIRLADTFEDLREGPEPVDVEITQALSAPAVPAQQLTGNLLPEFLPPVSEYAAVTTLDIPADIVSGLLYTATPPDPPLSARLFQSFSVYRL